VDDLFDDEFPPGEQRDGSIAVIGADITEQLGVRPLPDARCASDERIVRISRKTLIAAWKDIPGLR
jgi:hypothetical protein